jgi:uncharacterized DUF497 family protein
MLYCSYSKEGCQTHTVTTNGLTSRVFCNYNKCVITWDETKRQKNRKAHGIDLAEAGCVFDAPMVTVEDTREVYGELRLQSLGWFRERVVFLVWTERDNGAHLISCRYGDKYEARAYFEALGI